MSKLKAFDVGLGQYCEDGSPCVVAFATGRTPRVLNEKIYLKSEADKVIAEKDKKIDLYKRGFEEIDKINAYLFAEARNHKYKRCLAMANYCYTNVHCIMGHRLCALSVRKKEWFDRWHNRWLELAEKFKEAK